MQDLIEKILSRDLKIRKLGLLILKKQVEIPDFLFNDILDHRNDKFIIRIIKEIIDSKIIYYRKNKNIYRMNIDNNYYYDIAQDRNGRWIISISS